MWRKKLKIMATAELHWHIFCKLEDQRVKDVEDKCTSVPESEIEEVVVGRIESMSNVSQATLHIFSCPTWGG